MSDLRGLYVLVTKPALGGQVLTAQITARQGKAIHYPTLTFGPPKDIEAFNQALARLDKQDWLIFISPQAVYASIPAIGPITHSQIAAVGIGTAKVLQENGYQVAAYPVQASGSESLLALDVFQAVQEKRIMLIRGEEGRDLLASTLEERGGIVSHLIAYTRLLPKSSLDSAIVKEMNVIIGTSFEGVKNLTLLVNPLELKLLKTIPLIVISDRIKALAHDLGFQTICVSRNASSEAILELLAERKEELCQVSQAKSSQ